MGPGMGRAGIISMPGGTGPIGTGIISRGPTGVGTSIGGGPITQRGRPSGLELIIIGGGGCGGGCRRVDGCRGGGCRGGSANGAAPLSMQRMFPAWLEFAGGAVAGASSAGAAIALVPPSGGAAASADAEWLSSTLTSAPVSLASPSAASRPTAGLLAPLVVRCADTAPASSGVVTSRSPFSAAAPPSATAWAGIISGGATAGTLRAVARRAPGVPRREQAATWRFPPPAVINET